MVFLVFCLVLVWRLPKSGSHTWVFRSQVKLFTYWSPRTASLVRSRLADLGRPFRFARDFARAFPWALGLRLAWNLFCAFSLGCPGLSYWPDSSRETRTSLQSVIDCQGMFNGPRHKWFQDKQQSSNVAKSLHQRIDSVLDFLIAPMMYIYNKILYIYNIL